MEVVEKSKQFVFKFAYSVRGTLVCPRGNRVFSPFQPLGSMTVKAPFQLEVCDCCGDGPEVAR
jgi:hypothetical protein